jgi:phosphoribosylformylglycinamidine cyclo-ligase
VRVLPTGCRARIDPRAWPLPRLFRWLAESGSVSEADARVAFNQGIGMLVLCAPSDAPGLVRDLESAGERVFEIGLVTAGERGVEWAAPREARE